MIVELGHFALILSVVLSAVLAVVPMMGAYKNNYPMMQTATYVAPVLLILLLVSFGSLMNAYAQSDFSVANVWQNSHSDQPFIYKLSSTWGNHEGSMLLWVLILGVFAGLVAMFGGNLPPTLKANVLGVQGIILFLFLGFVILTSNPFERLSPAPFEGRDLNPILQDFGLAIHPPLLYLGYVGFSIAFSFAVAALIDGKIDAAWARWVRPWALLAWVFLTAGIAMGSYWAYYELGWGGWWFWDPVENASFMPWLTGTALLHSAMVMEKRSALKIWTVLLAILTFAFSLLGTFLVRSGVLTSVHTFASSPERGIVILAILILLVGGSLALFTLRSGKLQAGGLFAPISREGALVFNNLILTVAAGSVLVGTLYPLLLETLTGEKASFGAPFFNFTFGPIMLPLFIALPFGPLLSWKRGDLYAAFQRLLFALIASFIAFVLILGFNFDGPFLAPIGAALAVWLMVGAFAELHTRSGFPKVPFNTAVARLSGLPRSFYGTALAHFGVGVTLMGIVMVTAFEQENILSMKPGDTTKIAGYTLRYDGTVPRKGPNYVEDVVRLVRVENGVDVEPVEPTKRFYPARRTPTTEASIHTYWFSQLYVSVGEKSADGAMVVRIWWKPFVTLIWIGAMLMALAGIISLSDRRLRVGAPKPAKNRAAANA